MRTGTSFCLTALILAVSSVGCGGGSSRGGPSDATAPAVVSTNPNNSSTGIFLNTKVTAIFSEPMAPGSISATTFTLKQGVTAIPGTVTFADKTALFSPTSVLAASSLYTATITTDVTDLAGNRLAASKVWTFTTGTTQDAAPPTVISSDPADLATDVPSNRNVAATFSEAIDPTTITTAFTLKETVSGTPVPGSASAVSSVATFNPTGDLQFSTGYTATITTAVTDLAGNALAAGKVWTFTTGSAAAVAQGPLPVLLGTAGNFVILAKSGISTVPTSALTGDIGVSPIDQTALTGFSETLDASNEFSTATQVVGQIFAADYAPPTPTKLTTAVSDMELAYTDAAGRSNPDFTELGAKEIGGLTLVPGLYKWGTDLLITTTVTLSGGPNDVWIFQIAEGITQANDARVELTGGALPKNVFWQCGGTANIGTGSHFQGVLLSQTAINLGTGATAKARLLAQTAVTLAQSTVTQPDQ